jgi:hypothetical protein
MPSIITKILKCLCEVCKIWKLNLINQSWNIWNGQVGQALDCFEHANEYSNYKWNILRGAISLPRCRNLTKTPCITKRVQLQLCSLLRHRKFFSLYKWSEVPFLCLSTSQVLLMILCSVAGNTRDVTTKQMDRSHPVPPPAANSRYQHAVCCV